MFTARSELSAGTRQRSSSSLSRTASQEFRDKEKEKKDKARQAIESIGFDINESKQYITYLNGQTMHERIMKGTWRWLFLVLAGICMGMIAVMVAFLVHNINHTRQHMQEHLFESGQGLFVRYLVWMSTAMVLAAGAGYFVCYQQVCAAGSGIPEIKCILNGIDLPDVLRWPTLICKSLGIVCSVTAGLPCGKEGPMIHCGSIIAAQIKHVAPALGLGSHWRLPVEARDFVVAGAAAGVSAAFGAPLGGCLFAVEEGASHMNPRILIRAFLCAGAAALTVRFFMGPMEGATEWGVLGTETPAEFGRFQHHRVYTVFELPIFALMGVSGGLAGALFNALNVRLTLWRMKNVPKVGKKRFLEVLLVAFLIISFKFFAPLLAGDPDVNISEYKVWQRLFIDLGGGSIRILYHHQEYIRTGGLLFFAISHYLMMIITYGLGVPSGLFVPSLLGGAVFGRILGQLLASTGSSAFKTSPGIYALVGSISMMSGMARITISLAVLLMETTGEAQWCVPLVIACFTATWVGNRFNKGIYDIHIFLKHVPLLEQRPHRHTLNMCAKDIMKKNVVCVRSCSTVSELLGVLKTGHGAFPVSDTHSGRFLGLIDRSTLSHVLQLGRAHGILQTSASGKPQSVSAMIPFEAMLQHKFPLSCSEAEIRAALDEDDLSKVVELRPYTNVGSHTVQSDATVMRCHVLFRSLGLRHLPVVDDSQTVCGMISRKELVAAGEEAEEMDHHGIKHVANKVAHEVNAEEVQLELDASPGVQGRKPAGGSVSKIAALKQDSESSSPRTRTHGALRGGGEWTRCLFW